MLAITCYNRGRSSMESINSFAWHRRMAERQKSLSCSSILPPSITSQNSQFSQYVENISVSSVYIFNFREKNVFIFSSILLIVVIILYTFLILEKNVFIFRSIFLTTIFLQMVFQSQVQREKKVCIQFQILPIWEQRFFLKC